MIDRSDNINLIGEFGTRDKKTKTHDDKKADKLIGKKVALSPQRPVTKTPTEQHLKLPTLHCAVLCAAIC